MFKKGYSWILALFLVYLPTTAEAQLVAVNDSFALPHAQQLQVEAPGVMDNDLYNGESLTDYAATVELVSGPAFGTLECLSDSSLLLCPDGSFAYRITAGFPGSDSFVYRAVLGLEVAEATVTLTACDRDQPIIPCWHESEFLAVINELGYATFQEGFEDDVAWGAARYPFSAPSVVSQGIKWESNHILPPAENEITTSPVARTGEYRIFDPEHGYATGSELSCDIDNPPEHCLYKDGFTGTRQPGESKLYAVGGYISGIGQPKVAFILDAGPATTMGWISAGGYHFYGVIDPSGFDSFRLEELDGKIGQVRYVYGDDFTFGISLDTNFSDSFE